MVTANHRGDKCQSQLIDEVEGDELAQKSGSPQQECVKTLGSNLMECLWEVYAGFASGDDLLCTQACDAVLSVRIELGRDHVDRPVVSLSEGVWKCALRRDHSDTQVRRKPRGLSNVCELGRWLQRSVTSVRTVPAPTKTRSDSARLTLKAM